MKFVAGLLGGLILAVLSMFLVSIASAGSSQSSGAGGATVLLITWIIAFIVALTAPRAAKAWRRLFLLSGIVSFLMPLVGADGKLTHPAD